MLLCRRTSESHARIEVGFCASDSRHDICGAVHLRGAALAMSAHCTHANKKLARDPAGSSGAVQQLAYLLLCQHPRLREPAEGLSTKSLTHAWVSYIGQNCVRASCRGCMESPRLGVPLSLRAHVCIAGHSCHSSAVITTSTQRFEHELLRLLPCEAAASWRCRRSFARTPFSSSTPSGHYA